MDRFRLAGLVFIAAAAVSLSRCAAQANEAQSSLPYPVKSVQSDAPTTYRARTIPKTQTLTAFTENGSDSQQLRWIAYRTAERMNAADQALAARMQPAIRTAAVQAGMDFAQTTWSYRQLDCQALPNHLLLLFESKRGPGDVSRFSLSIPRGEDGRLRIIPIERRGFSLFSPAPVNSLAVAAFNSMRREEPNGGQPADWLAVSLCYAALTAPGGEVALAPRDAEANPTLVFPPSIEEEEQGESTVRLVDVAFAGHPMQWALTYDGKGQLLKVQHFPAPVYATRIMPKN